MCYVVKMEKENHRVNLYTAWTTSLQILDYCALDCSFLLSNANSVLTKHNGLIIEGKDFSYFISTFQPRFFSVYYIYISMGSTGLEFLFFYVVIWSVNLNITKQKLYEVWIETGQNIQHLLNWP